MTTISRSALVPYSAAKMFALVDDIPRYPEFLPWCTEARERSRTEEEVEATLALSKAGIEKTFTTRNRLHPHKMIKMRLVEGPFKHLEGYWRFQTLDDEACKVSLDIEFEFTSRLLSATLGPVFSQICNSLVDSFMKRAGDLYGR